MSYPLLAALLLLAWPGPDPAPKPPANRLAKETSPYLLLHAHNPVDWHPWGPEAFAKARAEGKPIFLSVGYSACYWCHVMERESFENPAIAKVINDGFIAIKVDREERPDVDQVYMTALQAFGQGGWPMSMFLTPDGRPFFGGTYFPPADRDGMEGFPSILKRVQTAWRDQRADIEKDADRLSESVRRALDAASSARKLPLTRTRALDGVAALAEQFDPEYGGFGFNPLNARRPKFPEPVNLVFLLDRHRRDPRNSGLTKGQPTPLDMTLLTMDRMARGGIRDQLAGGYHRYATSRYWIVPHFEKMLYDNAQLASAHLLAFEATSDPRWKAEAEATLAFVARSMTGPEGGFYSALDAETEGEEGKSYVWTVEQVKSALGAGPDVDAFLQVYGLRREPNFEKDRHVLLQPRPLAEQAENLKLTPESLEARLAPLRARLLAARDKRPAPLVDDKVLTAWNGLMIAAYADAYRLLKTPAYKAAADRSADFLLATLRTPDGRLLRTYRAGVARLPAYLEDYAFLAHGLLRLHAATGDPKRLEQARALLDRMIADFDDPRSGGFFDTAGDHESLIARPKSHVDGVLPSGNSVAILDLLALARLTREPKYLDPARRALETFSARLAQAPSTVPLMLVALDEYLDARPEADAPALAANPAPEADDDLLGGKDAVVVSARAKGPARPGQPVEVAVTITLKPGWHTYANPTGVEGIAPTRVTIDPGQGLTLVDVTYPPGAPKVLASSGKEQVALYEKEATLLARVKLDPDAPAGARPLALTVHYQACNDRACLAPARARLVVPLRFEPPGK